MAYRYTLNCGQYVLTDDGRPIGPVLDAVGISLSRQDGVLHKHGPVSKVEEWAAKQQKRLRALGCGAMADDIVVISGRFPLEEINRCLSTMDYAGRLYKQVLAGTVAELPLAAVDSLLDATKAACASARPRCR